MLRSKVGFVISTQRPHQLCTVIKQMALRDVAWKLSVDNTKFSSKQSPHSCPSCMNRSAGAGLAAFILKINFHIVGQAFGKIKIP